MMNAEPLPRRRSWRSNLLLTGGVITTVLMALILAQLDTLQVRASLIPPGLPIINIQATAIAVGNVIPLAVDLEIPLTLEPVTVAQAPDDLNPRPEFITGVSEEGIIFTVCGEVPEGWLLYTVKPGETLASLAAGTETEAAALASANCVTDGQLAAGMQILVPRQPAETLCGPPQWWVRYQVRAGDTLGLLAALRGTTIDEILRANCREESDLQAGQLIFLPPGPPSGGAAAPAPQPSLTPLPAPTDVPTLAPLPTATTGSEPPPPPTEPPPPSPTNQIVVSPVTPPTATPPTLPTSAPPTFTPQPPPTLPPATEPPPTSPPPTSVPPTDIPPPTVTPPAPPTDVPPPTSPPPTEPSPTEPAPTEPPPPTDPPPAPGED